MATPPQKKRAHRRPTRSVGRFVAESLVFLRAVQAIGEAVAFLTPYGFGQERISALLTRLEGLDAMNLQQEGALQASHAATAAAWTEESEFRRWFTPWRRVVRHALAERPDLRQRVGAV